MFINKIVLSIYEFPSFAFLAASQFLFTSVIILGLKSAGKVQVTPLSWEVLRVMTPLILISLVNVLSGLGGTQKLNLPMFTVRTSSPVSLALSPSMGGVALGSSGWTLDWRASLIHHPHQTNARRPRCSGASPSC